MKNIDYGFKIGREIIIKAGSNPRISPGDSNNEVSNKEDLTGRIVGISRDKRYVMVNISGVPFIPRYDASSLSKSIMSSNLVKTIYLK